MIQAVVFDMDGVVVDSERHWREAERDYLAPRVTRPIDQAALMGMSMEGFYAALIAGYGLTLGWAEFKGVYRSMARDIYERRCALMPGFAELKDALAWERTRVGLASSSPDEWVNLVIARFGLRFDAVADADDVGGQGKPSPAIYLEAARRLEVSPGACVAIEDSDNGVRAAKAAGLACVGLRTGINDDQSLGAADLEVPSLRALTPAILKGLAVSAR